MSNGRRGFDADVILGGGGLVGQTLALALDQAGLSVAVIDASKPADTLAPTFDGRAFAIAFASFRMWRALGIADQIDAQPIEQIMVTDGRVGDGVRKAGRRCCICISMLLTCGGAEPPPRWRRRREAAEEVRAPKVKMSLRWAPVDINGPHLLSRRCAPTAPPSRRSGSRWG